MDIVVKNVTFVLRDAFQNGFDIHQIEEIGAR